LGRSVGGLSTKIHTLTDALGNPVKFMLTAGNVHDIVPSLELLNGIKNAHILADKAYFSEENIKILAENGNTVVIPAK
ncbi:transposase, partial [Francisella hispaniensis]|uniref:transposase n=1 Tax=Francisella hispaniensis TaxID=622488 RepID=UPI0019079616